MRVVAVLLVLAAVGAFAVLRMRPPEPVPAAPREAPTRALAARAAEKLAALRHGDRVAFSAAELESLLLFEHPGLLPGFVDSARILLSDDRVRIGLRVPMEHVPLDLLGGAAVLLPDTTPVSIGVRIEPWTGGRAALRIEALRIADVPVPAALFPRVLERLGRADEAGLPRDALVLPLPPGARVAYVRGDSLVLASGSADAGS